MGVDFGDVSLCSRVIDDAFAVIGFRGSCPFQRISEQLKDRTIALLLARSEGVFEVIAEFFEHLCEITLFSGPESPQTK